jgi:O-antigen ligase
MIGAGGAAASLIAALYTVDVEQGAFPKPLIVLVGLAGAIVLVNIEPERLFLSWLVLAPLLQGLPKTSWGHGMQLALYIAPALVLALHTIFRRVGRSPVAWFDFLPAAYVVLVFGSMALTTNLLRSAPTSSLHDVFQAVAVGPIVYYFVAFRTRRSLTTTRIMRVLLISCAVQGAMALVEFPTGWNLWGDNYWHDRTGDFARSVATLQNPAVLGTFVGVGIAAGLAVLAWGAPRELRRPAIAAVVLGLSGVAFTFTRGPIVATLIVGLLVVLLKGRTRLMGIGVIAAAALALAIAWPSLSQTSVYRGRAAQSENVQLRVVLQDWSIRLAKEKPILGWGYQSFDRVKNSANFSAGLLPVALGLENTSHNTYLTVLVESGGVGLLLLLGPFAAMMLSAVRRARAPSSDRWLLIAAPAAILVIVLTGVTLDYRFFSFVPAVPWLFLGLLRRVIPPQGASV